MPEQFRVVALAAGANLEELAGQIARHRPQLVSVADAAQSGGACGSGWRKRPTVAGLPEIQ